jgi:hypothetical protein
MITTPERMLQLSHLPVYFWTELKGGRELYGNPGFSLRSYVIPNCDKAIIALPKELDEVYSECLMFTETELPNIIAWLEQQFTECEELVPSLAKTPKLASVLEAEQDKAAKVFRKAVTLHRSRATSTELTDPIPDASLMQACIDAKAAIAAFAELVASVQPKTRG